MRTSPPLLYPCSLSLNHHIPITTFSLSTTHRTHPIIFTFMPHELHHHSHINTHAYPFLLSTPFSLSTPHIPHAYPFLTPLLPLIPRFLSTWISFLPSLLNIRPICMAVWTHAWPSWKDTDRFSLNLEFKKKMGETSSLIFMTNILGSGSCWWAPKVLTYGLKLEPKPVCVDKRPLVLFSHLKLAHAHLFVLVGDVGLSWSPSPFVLIKGPLFCFPILSWPMPICLF